MTRNRGNFRDSPQLTAEWQRLERDASAKQNLLSVLNQDYEEVRIREVRDTPTITVVEPPAVSSLPEPRGRAVRILLGLILGAMFSGATFVVSHFINRRSGPPDADADEFLAAWSEARDEFRRRFGFGAPGTPS